MIVKVIVKPCLPLEGGGEHEGDNVCDEEDGEDDQDLVRCPHVL